ncbi:MAG: hypothetical protein ACFCUL_13230 [Flavobacteriaceae bacterium]
MNSKRVFLVAMLFCAALVNFSCEKESASADEEIYSIKKSEIDNDHDT